MRPGAAAPRRRRPPCLKEVHACLREVHACLRELRNEGPREASRALRGAAGRAAATRSRRGRRPRRRARWGLLLLDAYVVLHATPASRDELLEHWEQFVEWVSDDRVKLGTHSSEVVAEFYSGSLVAQAHLWIPAGYDRALHRAFHQLLAGGYAEPVTSELVDVDIDHAHVGEDRGSGLIAKDLQSVEALPSTHILRDAQLLLACESAGGHLDRAKSCCWVSDYPAPQ